jgi:rhodanese-related sulfurtransferase
MNLKTLISTLATGTLMLALQGPAHATAPSVSLEAARTALEKSTATVVDIREPSEQASGVAKGALLIPMGQISKRLSELPKGDSKPLLVICNTQNRSTKIADQLQAAGYTNVSFVQGGMSQWTARGWPMVKP